MFNTDIHTHAVQSGLPELNFTIEKQEVKPRTAKKNNRFKEFLFNACVEVGAWLLSIGFFVGIAWLAATIF